MAQEERELQVRALDGRSTAVTLAAAASVRDLKAAVRSSFPPAQISHNFHLFLKVRRPPSTRLSDRFGGCRCHEFVTLRGITAHSSLHSKLL
jgi:hypothetical protein